MSKCKHAPTSSNSTIEYCGLGWWKCTVCDLGYDEEDYVELTTEHLRNHETESNKLLNKAVDFLGGVDAGREANEFAAQITMFLREN